MWTRIDAGRDLRSTGLEEKWACRCSIVKTEYYLTVNSPDQVMSCGQMFGIQCRCPRLKLVCYSRSALSLGIGLIV